MQSTISNVKTVRFCDIGLINRCHVNIFRHTMGLGRMAMTNNGYMIYSITPPLSLEDPWSYTMSPTQIQFSLKYT